MYTLIKVMYMIEYKNHDFNLSHRTAHALDHHMSHGLSHAKIVSRASLLLLCVLICVREEGELWERDSYET